MSTQPESPSSRSLLTVAESAMLLNVSECWVRRHKHELPVVRLGRLVRFDPALLSRQIQGILSAGNRLEPERRKMLSVRRWQQGYVYKTGAKVKVWYGMFREDVRKMDGALARRQKNIRLGTLSELPTKSAAISKLSQLISTTKPSVEMRFEDLVQRWTDAIVPTLNPQTSNYYLKMLRLHVTPEFGPVQVTGIARHDVGMFLARKAPQGYSRSSMKGMITSLSTVLEYAVECDVLEKNPCKGVKLPQPLTPARKRRILTPDEATQIAGKLKDPYATLFIFLAVTGLRIGEACGIRWSAIDADGVLHVRQKVYEGKVGSLKTKSSERKLPIPPDLLSRLKALGSGEWVFPSRAGTPVNAGNALKRYIHPAAKSLGIELTGWHDLRHSATTKMIRDGVSPKTVSKIMGHSNLNITLGIYDHPDIQDFRAPLNEMASQLL